MGLAASEAPGGQLEMMQGQWISAAVRRVTSDAFDKEAADASRGGHPPQGGEGPTAHHPSEGLAPMTGDAMMITFMFIQ